MNDGGMLARLLSAKVFSYANNRITVLGTIIATVSGIVITVLLLASLGGAFHNPYAAIVAYTILPAVLVLGLLLIPAGMLLRRRRLLKEGGDPEALQYPCLDFNDPHLRRVATGVILLTIVNAVIIAASAFLSIESMDSVAFCGLTCHTVMQPEYTAYQQSPHSHVACVKCHIGPGASFFVRSKIDGLRQVWHTMLDDYPRPITTPLVDLRPARETCEQCHWPAKHYGDKIRIIPHFAHDEESTASYTAMLLKTGGGSLDTGRHGGVHWWHIYSDNRIRYLATDQRRQEIAWVELRTPSGEERVYTRDGEEPPAAAQIAAEARTMDCIDCHNRPTHLFKPPEKALDDLLAAYPSYQELPFFKRQALAAVEQDYPSHAAGLAGVSEAMTSFYAESYPEVAGSRAELVQQAAAAVAAVYGRTTFPEMRTNWETHPTNIGHDDFPGCWRCHDDELTTADGEHTIPQDCDTCHLFLVEDSPQPPDLGAAVFE